MTKATGRGKGIELKAKSLKPKAESRKIEMRPEIIRAHFCIKQITFGFQPPLLVHHKNRVAKQQFTILPKLAEQGIVNHINYRAATQVLNAQ